MSSYSSNDKIKIIMVGDSNCGKTALIRRFVYNVFIESKIQPTLETDILFKSIKVDGSNHKLEIWDTVGQERFHAIPPLFCREAKCVVLVYDVTEELSFRKLSYWRENILNEVAPKNPDDLPFVLIGNKADEENRVVSKESVQTWSKLMDIPHFDCSAKTNQNVDLAFHTVVKNFLLKNAQTTNVPFDGERSCADEKQEKVLNRRGIAISGNVSLNSGNKKRKKTGCKCKH